MKLLSKLFKPKHQGKHFTKSPSFDAPSSRRTIQFSAAGAVAGGIVGLQSGMAAADKAIASAPTQEVRVEHLVPITNDENLGLIPRDEYSPGPIKPQNDGVPTEAVIRPNPVYDANGKVQFEKTTTVLRGQGTPSEVKWETEPVLEHSLNSDKPYDFRAVANTEKYISGTQSVRRERMVPKQVWDNVLECEKPIGAGFDDPVVCTEERKWVTKYEPESYWDEEPTYSTRTVGYEKRYYPNIETKVMGEVQVPSVSFEHGVSTAGHVVKGVLIGAFVGALAGGVMAALEENYFPHKLPGY